MIVLSAFLFIVCLFLLVFSVLNYQRAETERIIKAQLEDESETFNNVLLDHLAEWKYWKEEKEFSDKCLKVSVLNNKTMKEALEYIALKPQFPKIKEALTEIPGEACQKARDVLNIIKG